MTAVLILPPKVESLSHFEDVDLVILGEEYGDDLIEEITASTGWCIKSINYEVQLK